MAQTFTTNEADWQGVDDVPIGGSPNLVRSGGVVLALAPYIDKVTFNIPSQYNLYEYSFIQGNSYKIKNNTGGTLVTFIRQTADGENLDRTQISANSEGTFTASVNASYIYIYKSATGTVDVYSLSTGENLLQALKNKVFDNNYTSETIGTLYNSGIYKDSGSGNILLVRKSGTKTYQNEIQINTDGTDYSVRSRHRDSTISAGAWTEWEVRRFGSDNNYAILQCPSQSVKPNVTTTTVSIPGTCRFVWNNGGRVLVSGIYIYRNSEWVIGYDSQTGMLTLDISTATVGAQNYNVILNKTNYHLSVVSIAATYDKYDNILLFSGNSTGLWCSLDCKYNGVSKYNNTSEIAQIFHTGIMPNYNTASNTIEFSSFTSFITPNGRYRVNDMSGFADDKLSVNLGTNTAFKLLIDKLENALVAVSISDNSYDPANYILVMTGRTTNLYFSVPISVDGVSIESKVTELYNNEYGESDDIKEFQYTNNDMIWTWWDYPQAIVGTRNNGHLFFGYTDAAGHVGVCEYDPERDTYTKCNLRKHNNTDDHNSGTVVEDENGKLIFLSDGLHGASQNIHWRKTKKIENLDTFERDKFISIGGQCVYTQAHKIGNTWYVFSRRDAMSWIYVSTEDFVTWTEPKVIVTSNVQWYCLFKPVTDADTKLRIAMYSNPTAGDSSIRLAYIDLSDDKIYDGDGTTVLGTAGTGVDKDNVSVLIAAVSPKKIRLQDLAITAMDDVVISYYDMEDYEGAAQYKVYRNGTIINTVVSDKPIGFSYHGGQMFVGDNKDKIVVSRYDSNTDYDIIETYEYSSGSYVFVKEYHRTKAEGVPPAARAKNIREGRPRTDTTGKYIITHIGYLWFRSEDPNHPNYQEFMTSANVYKIEEHT